MSNREGAAMAGVSCFRILSYFSESVCVGTRDPSVALDLMSSVCCILLLRSFVGPATGVWSAGVWVESRGARIFSGRLPWREFTMVADVGPLFLWICSVFHVRGVSVWRRGWRVTRV